MIEFPAANMLLLHIDSLGGLLGAMVTAVFIIFSTTLYFTDRQDRLSYNFIWLNLVMLPFLLGFAIFSSGRTLEMVDTWTRISYSALAFVPVAFRGLINVIVGDSKKWLKYFLFGLGLFWYLLIWTDSGLVIGSDLRSTGTESYASMQKGPLFLFFQFSVLFPVMGCWVRFIQKFLINKTFRKQANVLFWGISAWIVTSIFDALIAVQIIPNKTPILWFGPTFMLLMMAVYFARYVKFQGRKLNLLAAEKEIFYQQMIRDDLTGTFSRSYINSMLKHELEKLKRYPGTHSLIFIDVDDFKTINDALGHRVGDQLLLEVAGIFRDSCRSSDIVARYGGDEFLILALNCNERQSVWLSQRVLANYQKLVGQLRDHLQGFSPGLSIGIAPSTFWNDKVEDVVAQADYAMYQAKGSGKNKIMLITGRDDEFHWQVEEPEPLINFELDNND